MAQASNNNYPRVGTTGTIFIPREASPKVVLPDNSYFRIKIHSAQAAFRGSFWERVQRLIVMSQVALNHPVLSSEPMRAIQRSREVTRSRAEQLGLSPNLINLVPATMTHVSVVVEFLLDKQNRLAQLAGLINDDAFVAAVSLAPGVAPVARAIAGLSQKLIQTFLEPEDRRPILQFSGDFDIVSGDLKEGYYLILGSRDEDSPLPDPGTSFKVANGSLMTNGTVVTQLSYIILEVQCLPARTRGLNDGAIWDGKLRQAEAIAQSVSNDPFADDGAKERAWVECRTLLKEAQLLLLVDSNYLRREAMDIIKTAMVQCTSLIFATETTRSRLRSQPASDHFQILRRDLSLFDISPDANLSADLSRYAEQVAEARRLIRKENIT